MATATANLAEGAPAAIELAAAPSAADGARTYTCPECGHRLRFSGGGRHRLFFELHDQRVDDPIMDGGCPECGRRLPGKNGGRS